MGSFKYEVEGSYSSEEEAVKDLADKYMQSSRFDIPGEHFMELVAGTVSRSAETCSKGVYFQVYEEIYGHEQWIMKYRLRIHPFKSDHWYKSIKDPSIKMPETEFIYSVSC